MKIGIDVDGTISSAGFSFLNPSLKIPWCFFIFLVPLVSIIKPKEEAIRKIKELKSLGNEIIIVSARPPWATDLTKRWLRRHKVPFDKVLCLGFGKGTKRRKLKAIKEEKIEYFFDNDRELLKFLNQNSIKARQL